MKLHLPKMLLTAVLAACSTAYAFGPQVEVEGVMTDVGYTEITDVTNGEQSPTVNTYYSNVENDGGTISITTPEGKDKVHIKLGIEDVTGVEDVNKKDKEAHLGTISAASTWIAEGRFNLDSANDVAAAGDLYVNGGALHIGAGVTIQNNITLGTSTYASESWKDYSALNSAALIVGLHSALNQDVTLSGNLTIAENAKICMQSGYDLNLTGDLVGSANLEFSRYSNKGNANSIITFSGSAAEYTGNITINGFIDAKDNNKVYTNTLKLTGTGTNLLTNAASITVGDYSVLDLASRTGGFTDNFVDINNNGKVTTSRNGYILLGNAGDFEISLPNDISLAKNYKVEGNLDVNGKGYETNNGRTRSLTIGEGKSFVVGGKLSFVTNAVLVINGGTVEAGSMGLGHKDSYNQAYWGKVTMNSGSLKTGTIDFRQNYASVIDISGGTLEFSASAALNRGSNTASTVSIKGTSGEDSERVVLKATSTDWTLDGAGLTTKPVIGNVTIDAGNTHSITFANVALSGSVVSNAELALGSGITVVAGNSATLATGGDGVIVLGDTIQNSGSIELGGTLKLAGVPSDFAEKSVGSKSYVLDANKPAVTNDGQNGFVLTSAAQYWVVQGANSTLASENMTIGDAYNNTYNLTAAENGIYLTTGDNYVATDKYYITTGDVTVVGTGAENATGADSYILQGGTMQLTGGTVKTSEIVYSSGNVHLHKEATIVLDNLEKLETNTVSGAYTNVFDGTMYSGSGTLEFQLHGNNGRGLDLSNFEGSIVVSKASGETYGRLQVNSSILHENATITLSDGGELVFNSDNVTLSNALTVKGNSQLHVNSTHKATITSAIDGGGTLIKVGNSSTLNLNGNISVGLFQTNGGTTNVIGGSVTNLKANGGTTNIQAGTLTNLSIAGGTTYVTGGKITDIAYTNNGTVNFNLAQGVESSKLSVDNIILTTANNTDYYNRHINVASGVTLTVGEIKNQWGMGTIDVDGALTAETITMTSGGDGEDKNVITGDGQITTDSLVITNAGNYRVSAATLTINNELKQDKATISQYGGTINVEGSLNSSGGNINQHGGTINVNGLLNNTGATMNLFDGQMNVNNTEGINKIYMLDMAGDNDRNGKLNLAAGSALEVSSNFWLGGTSVITLNEGAILSKDGMTITGKGTSSTITRLTAGDSNNFYASSDDHEIKNSAVSITKESENGNTLALKLTNSSVANDSTSRLVVSNTANTLTGVYANKGELALTGLAELQLQDLVVKSGATLSVGNVVATVDEGSSNQTTPSTSVSETATLHGGATINSRLDLSNASSLTLNGIGENSLVMINGDLILPSASETPTLTLSGGILTSLAAMNLGDELGIFSVRGGFFVGNQVTNALDATNGIALNTVFSASGDNNFEGYYLGFYNIPDEAGYSTVYIGKIVPEPTTATLSLLALAALAARRRRR